MATREANADPGDPILTYNRPAVDKGNGSIRLTIPSRIRDKLDIEPGDELVIDEYEGSFSVRPGED